MPITSANFQRAIQALAKAKSNPNSDPAQIARIQANIDQYLAESGQYGPAAPPAENQPAAQPSAQPSFSGRGSVAGYFYNPSLDEFRSALKDRNVRGKLGLPDTYQSGETVGQDYLKSQVPELSGLQKTSIDELTEASPEYKAYAEHAYQQALSKDPSIKRYDDLDIMENPGTKALGAAIKYGPAAIIGAEKNAGLGVPTALIKSQGMLPPTNPVTGQVIAPELTQTPEAQKQREQVVNQFGRDVDTLESLSPEASTVAGVVSYAMPFAPSNVAQGVAADALKYSTRGPIGKAFVSGAVGSGVSTAEGAVQDITDNPEISGQQLLENAVPRAIGGYLLGKAGDLVAQGAGRAQQVIRESPRYRDLKNLEDVGGNTNFVTGVSAPPAVRENITNAAKAREQRYPADIAAEKVAPKVIASNKAQVEAARIKSGKELEEYLNRPEIASQQESMQPVADNILSMFNRGTFEGAVSGDLKHPNAGAVKTFRDVLNSIGEVAYVSPEEAALYAKKNNGQMLSERHMKALGLTSQDGKVPVYVASKMPARALLEMEQMIDDRLKMANIEGGANNPIWKEVNRAVKSVRDKFGAPKPEYNVKGEPFAPASISPPAEIDVQKQNPVGINNPPQPEALPGIGNSPKAIAGNPYMRQGAYALKPDVPVVFDANGNIVNHQAVQRNRQPLAIDPQGGPIAPNNTIRPVQPFNVAPTGIQEDITNVPTDIRFGEEQNPMSRVPSGPGGLGSNPFSPKLSTPEGGQVSMSAVPEELSWSSVVPPDMTDSEWARFNNPSVASGPTHLQSPIALPEYVPQQAGRPIDREFSATDYETLKSDPRPMAPKGDWRPTLPEANQYLNENDYAGYLARTKSDAARQQNFAQSMEGQYWKRPAEMSEKEMDKEIIAILKGEGIDMNITPENRARVYAGLEEKGEQFAPYIARLKELEANQLAKQQAAKTGVPGEPRQSQYEELGSSAIVEDQSVPVPLKQPSIGERSAQAAYESGVAIPNQGTFTPSEVSREINEAGGVGTAGKLGKGMRDESLNREMSRYQGKSPEEVNQLAENLEYPVDVSIDNGNVMLRDGRHRLEAAKRAGAKNIRVRVRKFNADGKAEEVVTTALPINRISDVPPANNPSVSPVSGQSVANKSADPSVPVPQETLDDGTIVYGLSAMQRKHHKELERLNKLEGLTGTTEETAHKKVLNYKKGEGHPYNDQALAQEADRLGIRQELEEVPATRDFPDLRARAWYGGEGGLINSTKDFFILHGDPALGALAGTPPNPFAANPLTPAGRIQQYLFRQGVPGHPLLSGRAGLAGARFGEKVFGEKEDKK